jgi:hypothetical protein
MSPVPATLRRRDLAEMQGRAVRHRDRRPLDGARRRRSIGLWLPVTPFFWLLAPFAILLAPLIALAPPMRGVNPYAAVILIGQLLTSMSGTKVHVDTPDVRVRLTIL